MPGVSLIIGTNGYLWVQPATSLQTPPLLQTTQSVSEDIRNNMSLVRNVVLALDKAEVPIYRETIFRAVEATKRSKVAVRDIFKNFELVTKEAKEMVQKEINLQRP